MSKEYHLLIYNAMSLDRAQRFRGTYRLHLTGGRIRHARNPEDGGNMSLQNIGLYLNYSFSVGYLMTLSVLGLCSAGV
jgi:hypothetical protein